MFLFMAIFILFSGALRLILSSSLWLEARSAVSTSAHEWKAIRGEKGGPDTWQRAPAFLALSRQ